MKKKVLYYDQRSKLLHLRGSRTQAQFAEELGIHKGTYNRYETGKRKIPLGLLKLAIYLNHDRSITRTNLLKKYDLISIKDGKTMHACLERILESRQADIILTIQATINSLCEILDKKNINVKDKIIA